MSESADETDKQLTYLLATHYYNIHILLSYCPYSYYTQAYPDA